MLIIYRKCSVWSLIFNLSLRLVWTIRLIRIKWQRSQRNCISKLRNNCTLSKLKGSTLRTAGLRRKTRVASCIMTEYWSYWTKTRSATLVNWVRASSCRFRLWPTYQREKGRILLTEFKQYRGNRTLSKYRWPIRGLRRTMLKNGYLSLLIRNWQWTGKR